ncbi:hypothetical protein ACQ4M3_07635 [Leptolyngbya sp. AN03gr2]|uniref:hypothetical protein n=1 Tax=unclassified Leptolyngbya TaxID=2650499 RepID=UPI003D322A73
MIQSPFPPVSSEINDAFTLIERIDHCLLEGLSSISPAGQQTLSDCQQILAFTPLAPLAAELCNQISSKNPMGIKAIAIIRSALLGTLHDVLLNSLRQTLGRSTDLSRIKPAPQPSHPLSNSVQSFLEEIAWVGFARVTSDMIQSFRPVLEKIMQDPKLYNHGTMLSGLLQEMNSPFVNAYSATQRWADLWSKALVCPMPKPLEPPVCESGTLYILGVSVHIHSQMFGYSAYGILKGSNLRQVRISQTRYRPELLPDSEVWALHKDQAQLIQAISERQVLQIQEMPILTSGVLLWDESKASAVGTFDPLQIAQKTFGIEGLPSISFNLPELDRHPVAIAEPTYLEDYKILPDGDRYVVEKEGQQVRLATERLNAVSEVTIEQLLDSEKLFGILLFDAGEWMLHPMTLETSQGLVYTGQLAGQRLYTHPTLSTLKERASKLLRKA